MIFALIMILSFFVFIAIGVPIVLALLASSLTYLLLNPSLSLLLVPIKLFRSHRCVCFFVGSPLYSGG